ncbi:hypothetical protein MCUN1_002705 [Malassezia cuniculi]|uniref:Uncharacterized protein n=1 Tax=Malassezia cuniculi TaxID=948313 RepID=A0AAF0EW63_9BASI|nr:hypothetical protein MCUN1_002705 [Malassezia cuniculi]
MPQELPRVELEHPSDLDYIIDAVAKYANALAKQRVRGPSELGVTSPLEETLKHSIERWVYAARKRLVPNVLINGLTFDEYAKRAKALATRVRSLSNRVDEVTEKVVARRRSIPTEYSRAVARHSAALDALAEVYEEQRRAGILRSRKRPRFESIAAERPIGNPESRARAAESLNNSYTRLRRLPEVLRIHE